MSDKCPTMAMVLPMLTNLMRKTLEIKVAIGNSRESIIDTKSQIESNLYEIDLEITKLEKLENDLENLSSAILNFNTKE